MSKKEKGPTKVEQSYKIYQQLKAQEPALKPKEIFNKIAETLKISARAARSYVWRAEHPKEFKAMLDKYYAKRKARLAAEKKAAKTKKQKKEAPTPSLE